MRHHAARTVFAPTRLVTVQQVASSNMLIAPSLPALWPCIAPVLLLSCSNIFMTLAWYGHLKFKAALIGLGAVLVFQAQS